MSIPELSIVIPVYNEEESLPALAERLSAVFGGAALDYELVLVNDGSRDRSWSIMCALRERDPRITLVDLARNFGHQVAITAGMDCARGSAVAVMDADLQDPPEVVLAMLARIREGYDVAYGQRTVRQGETVFKRASAALFYRMLQRLTSVDIPLDTGDFRVLSRRAVEVLGAMREKHRFVRGMVAWLGFRQIAVPYDRAARHAGVTKYPLRKMLRFALDATISFSLVPLRLATWTGFLTALGCLGYAGYAVWAKLVGGVELPGWASLMVAVLFLGAVQLVCLGIIGEYLGRIYEEVKGRPLYVIAERRQGRPAA